MNKKLEKYFNYIINDLIGKTEFDNKENTVKFPFSWRVIYIPDTNNIENSFHYLISDFKEYVSEAYAITKTQAALIYSWFMGYIELEFVNRGMLHKKGENLSESMTDKLQKYYDYISDKLLEVTYKKIIMVRTGHWDNRTLDPKIVLYITDNDTSFKIDYVNIHKIHEIQHTNRIFFFKFINYIFNRYGAKNEDVLPILDLWTKKVKMYLNDLETLS